MTGVCWRQVVGARIALVPVLAMATMATTAFAACPLPSTALHRGAVQVAWTADTPPITVGRHFTIQVRLCPADAVLARVDATMPAHRHGMNYRPSLQALGGGRWRVDGLLWHMPGTWSLRLEVRLDGRTQMLQQSVDLQ